MSPVKRSTRPSAAAVLALAVAAVIGGIAIAVGVILLASSGGVEVRLGDERFEAGQVESIASAIERGGPLLYSDVGGGSRDIIVQHLGATPDSGWHAFDARPPGAPRDCFLEWQSDDGDFRDTCTGVRYRADGEGLVSYPTLVEEGRLVVDLNAPAN